MSYGPFPDVMDQVADAYLPQGWNIDWNEENFDERKAVFFDNLRREYHQNSSTADRATMFLMQNIPGSLNMLSFERGRGDPVAPGGVPGDPMTHEKLSDGDSAFHVRDFFGLDLLSVSRARNHGERMVWCRSGLTTPDFLKRLKKQRSTTCAQGREIVIRDITSSAIATIFMSQLRDSPDSYQYCERPDDVLALRRHISTNSEDRFFHHSSFGEANRTVWSTTLSFYQVYRDRPGKGCVPLAETGVFTSGFPTHDGDDKYIRQGKLTFSFTSICGDWENIHLSPRERNFWQVIAINPPRMHCLQNNITGISTQIEPLSLRCWVESCLDGIREKWNEVLNELDRQISVTNSVLFDEETRIKFLFDDENFNNSKRYFWALQSLRVFSETMEETIQFLPHMFEKFYILGVDKQKGESDSDLPTMEELNREMSDVAAKHVAKFEKIRDRIERKRQEVKGLSDGVSGILEDVERRLQLFSASSVAEARLAAIQNNNIRLLTLFSVTFLPMTFITSVYSMRILPEAANMLSFIICLILLTTTTVFIAVNLKILGRLFCSLYGGWMDRLQSLMLSDRPLDSPWKERGNKLRQAEKSKRKEPPISNWWYLGFILVLLARLHTRFWRVVWEGLVAVFEMVAGGGSDSSTPQPPRRPPSPRREYPTMHKRETRSEILYNAFLGKRRIDMSADEKADEKARQIEG